MKVSFRSTSVSASPSPGTLITDFRLKANRNENEKLETNNTERRLDDMGYVTESYDAVRQLKQERTDILKREEALKDRLSLQEAIYNKQIQDLRYQLRRLTAKQDTANLLGSKQKKREGKTKEYRELHKIKEKLKQENSALHAKLNKHAEFVQIAGDLKENATDECASKDKNIEKLKTEINSFKKLYKLEMENRNKAQRELDSLRIFVDQIKKKQRERCRNMLCQTQISIPPKLIIGRDEAGCGDKNTSFARLSSTAAALRLEDLASKYRRQSIEMKEKFTVASQKKHSLPSRLHAHKSSFHQSITVSQSFPKEKRSSETHTKHNSPRSTSLQLTTSRNTPSPRRQNKQGSVSSKKIPHSIHLPNKLVEHRHQ